MRMKYDIHRRRLPDKAWGVFPHRVVDRQHPLVRNINTRFDVPHSRWNEITREQLDDAGLVTLVESAEVGPHLVVSRDGFRQVFFQGHPEYDIDSLLKEYRREVLRYIRGERADYPPLVQHYFPEAAQTLLYEYKNHVFQQQDHGRQPDGSDFPEAAVLRLLDNTWADTASVTAVPIAPTATIAMNSSRASTSINRAMVPNPNRWSPPPTSWPRSMRTTANSGCGCSSRPASICR